VTKKPRRRGARWIVTVALLGLSLAVPAMAAPMRPHAVTRTQLSAAFLGSTTPSIRPIKIEAQADGPAVPAALAPAPAPAPAPKKPKPAPAPTPTAAPAAPAPGSGDPYAAIARAFPDVYDQAVAVANCESSMDPNQVYRGTYYGLFQISSMHRDWVEAMGYSWDQILDPYVNAQVARNIYDAAGGWGPWACKRVL
jgi:hypothetical protein